MKIDLSATTETVIDGKKYIVERVFSSNATETIIDKIDRLLINECRRESERKKEAVHYKDK